MRKHVWMAVCSGLVAACGGGGGDAPAAAQPTVGISSTNQDQVARTSASAVVSVAAAGTGTGATGSGGGAGVAALPGAARQVALALQGGRKAALAAGVQPLAVVTDTTLCPAGGQFVVAVNNANNNNAFDAGDSLTITFENCKTTATDNTNGSIAVTVASVSGTGFIGTMTLNLASTEGTRTGSVVGSVAASYTDVSATVSRTELLVGAAGLSGTVSIGNVSETITYENGFSIATTSTVNGAGAAVSSSSTVSGAITASGLANGRIVLATPAPIVQLAADAYPSSGALRATGTSGSTLLVTALSATQVRLQLDADGNGSYEGDKTVAWGVVLPN